MVTFKILFALGVPYNQAFEGMHVGMLFYRAPAKRTSRSIIFHQAFTALELDQHGICFALNQKTELPPLCSWPSQTLDVGMMVDLWCSSATGIEFVWHESLHMLQPGRRSDVFFLRERREMLERNRLSDVAERHYRSRMYNKLYAVLAGAERQFVEAARKEVEMKLLLALMIWEMHGNLAH
ncbi:hypothetical protein MANI_023805 [Metarhizium anisopliae]